MIIGVISDTHGNLAGWQRAMELGLSEADLIIHCGDVLYHGPKFEPAEAYNPKALAEAINACSVPVLIARGNGDSEVDQLVLNPPVQQPCVLAYVDGLRIIASHGHAVTPEKLLELAAAWKLDFVLTGHIHVPVLREVDGVVHLNPGTPTYPLAEDENLRRPTFALIRDGRPEIIAMDTGEVILSL